MSQPELYLLDWQDTAYGQQPEPSEVMGWLTQLGYIVEGRPKVYANGTVQLSCYPDPRHQWPDFEPVPQSPEQALAQHVHTVTMVRQRLLAIPESQRSETDEALLAIIGLLLYGFGVNDAR